MCTDLVRALGKGFQEDDLHDVFVEQQAQMDVLVKTCAPACATLLLLRRTPARSRAVDLVIDTGHTHNSLLTRPPGTGNEGLIHFQSRDSNTRPNSSMSCLYMSSHPSNGLALK